MNQGWPAAFRISRTGRKYEGPDATAQDQAHEVAGCLLAPSLRAIRPAAPNVKGSERHCRPGLTILSVVLVGCASHKNSHSAPTTPPRRITPARSIERSTTQ